MLNQTSKITVFVEGIAEFDIILNVREQYISIGEGLRLVEEYISNKRYF